MPQLRPVNSPIGTDASPEAVRERLEQDAWKFRVICAQAPMGICEFDRDGRMPYWNRQFLDIAGITVEEHVLGQWLKMIHPEDRGPLMENWPKMVLKPHEYRVLTPHRGLRWIRALVTATQHDSDGTPTHFVAMVADVTERLEAEHKLRASHQRLEAQVVQGSAELSLVHERLGQETAHRIQAEQDRSSFALLVENSNDLIALAEPDGWLLFLNAAGRALAGLGKHESLAGLTLADLHASQSHPLGSDAELATIRGQGRWIGESQLRNSKNGDVVDVLVNAFLIGDEQRGELLRIATVERDITEIRRSNQTVQASEERFRQLADNIDEVFWILEVPVIKILYVSPAYSRIWGMSREALYDNPFAFLDAVHPDDRDHTAQALINMASAEFEQEFRVVRGDGAIRTVHCRSIPIRDADGEIYRVGGITTDITDNKEADAELLAERRFLEHLLQLQERERKLIAYDIHDGFVQMVTAATMHLDALNDDPTVGESTRKRLEEPLALLRESIEEARRMISGLRPPIIDEQGLVAAIEYLIHEASARGGAKVLFSHDVKFHRLEGVLEGILFRIVQEALSNVYRHSQAQLAQVSLTDTADRLTMTIEDWGIGFDVEKTSGRQYGLRGIRERARLFGGTATIHSTLGLGTRITVEIPLKAVLGQAST